MRLNAFLMCTALMLAARSAHAFPYIVDASSGRAAGMASAVTAADASAASVVENPAALGDLAGLRIQASVSPLWHAYSGVEVGTSALGPFPLQAHVALPVAEGFALGAAFVEPFSYANGGIELRSRSFVAVGAWRVSDRLSLGAGVDLNRTSYSVGGWEPDSYASPSNHAVIDSASFGLGARVGVLFRLADDRLRLAATYRTAVSLELTGKATGLTRDAQDVTADLELPAQWSVAGLWRPAQPVSVALELRYIGPPESGSFIAVLPAYGINVRLLSSSSVRAGMEWAPVGMLRLRCGALFERERESGGSLLSGLTSGTDWLGGALGVGLLATHGVSFDAGLQFANTVSQNVSGQRIQGGVTAGFALE